MPDKILKYLRQNTIALLALFVALGGTSYAAFSISGNQIRNWSIDAVKLNPQSIAGLIKARVELQFKGSRLVATSSSAPVRVTTVGLREYIQWVHQRKVHGPSRRPRQCQQWLRRRPCERSVTTTQQRHSPRVRKRWLPAPAGRILVVVCPEVSTLQIAPACCAAGPRGLAPDRQRGAGGKLPR